MCDNCCTPFIEGEGCASALQKRASNVASGDYSIATGHGTIASNEGEMSTGTYNKPNDGQVFSVGVGTSDSNRMNAIQVNKDGSTSFLYDGRIVKLTDLIRNVSPSGQTTFDVQGGYIVVSYDGGQTYHNLIAISELKGDPGTPGAPGAPGQDADFNNLQLMIEDGYLSISRDGGETYDTVGPVGGDGEGGGSIVEVTQRLSSGVPIADIEVDGDTTTIFAPSGGGSGYVLEAATSSDLGGIKIGYSENGRNFAVKLNSANRAYVTVPSDGGGEGGQNGGYYEQIFRAFAHGTAVTDNDLPDYGAEIDDTGAWKHYIDDAAASLLGEYDVWMAVRWVTGDGTPDVWNGPWNISGPEGEAGADGKSIEFIYTRTANEDAPAPQRPTSSDQKSGDSPASTYQDDDWFPINWSDSPQGVTPTIRLEWMSFRIKTGGAGGQGGTWQPFSAPVIWSAYGRQGVDGDGVEYIYALGSTAPSGNANPHNWTSDTDFQNREYIRSGYANTWQDNPIDLSNSNPGTKQWVSTRRKYPDDVAHATYGLNPYWHEYTEPVLWSYKAKDGDAGTGIFADLQPNMFYIPCDENGEITSDFTGSTVVSLYNGAAAVPGASVVTSGITIKDTKATPTTYPSSWVSVSGMQVSITVPTSANINFSETELQISIPVTGTVNSETVNRTVVLTIIGVHFGTDGTDGTDGLNNATVALYQRSASAPSLPMYNLTYTFATGSLSGELGLWSQFIPDSNGQTCWVTMARAISSNPTCTIAPTAWTHARNFVNDGTNGTDGTDGSDGSDGVSYQLKTNTAVIRVRDNTKAPQNITASLIKTFADSTFIEYTPVATQSTPALPAGFSITYVVDDDTQHEITMNTNSISTGDIDDNIVIRLKYNNIVISEDQILVLEEPSTRATQSVLKSFVFKRSASAPSQPGTGTTKSGSSSADGNGITNSNYGGAYPNSTSGDIPIPYGWSDGVPAYNSSASPEENRLWMTTRMFTSDGEYPQQSSWTTVAPASDTQDVDIEYAYQQTNDAVPATPTDANRHGGSGTQIWFDPVLDSSEDFTEMYWMAIREKHNSTSGAWTIVRIKGERGENGISGKDALPIRIRNWNEVYGVTLTGDNKIFSGFEDNAPFRDVIVVTPEDYPSGEPCPFLKDNVTVPALMLVNYSSSYPNGYSTTGLPSTSPACDLTLPNGFEQSSAKNWTSIVYSNRQDSQTARDTYGHQWSVFQNLGAVYTSILVATQAYIGNLTVSSLNTAGSDTSVNERIIIRDNEFHAYDSGNIERMLVTADDISLTANTQSYTTKHQNITFSHTGESGSGTDTDSLSIVTFNPTGSDQTVTTPQITITPDINRLYDGDFWNLHYELYLKRGGSRWQTISSGTQSSVTPQPFDIASATIEHVAHHNSAAGYELVLDFSVQWELDPGSSAGGYDAISITLEDTSTSSLIIYDDSTNNVNIGKNGMAIRLGGGFNVIFGIDDNDNPLILLEGKNSNNATVGIRINSLGLYVNKGDGNNYVPLT